MEKAIADDVATNDVLWYAAERIGKSNSGDEIHRLCNYLVNKHWFQTAGDLRSAQLATEEWHSLEIPSRLKIAVQQVLDETPYQQQQYHQEQQAGSPSGYADYYYGATSHSEDHQANTYGHQAKWPADQTSYESYYYAHEPSTQSTNEGPASGGYYDYTAEATDYNDEHDEDLTADYLCPPPNYYDQAFDTTEAVASTESYFQYRAQHEEDETESHVVEAHAVVVEDAASYEQLLAPMHQQQPQKWGCRQCTFLNSVSESFCEMCHDHISASPDMASVLLPASAHAPESPPMKAERAHLHALEPSPGQSTPPVPPLYSPSAPSYEAMDCDDEDDEHQTMLLPPAPIAVRLGTTPANPSAVAKQLAFGALVSGDEDCEVIHPTKVVGQARENYLALAFKGASPMAQAPAYEVSAAEVVVVKSDQVRREEDAFTTEYSF